MESPEKSSTLPLDYAAELAFELHMMRGECCEAATEIVAHPPVDLGELEECARLDDALARAHRLLQHTINGIKQRRAHRDNPGK